jgi:hypothetical protein
MSRGIPSPNAASSVVGESSAENPDRIREQVRTFWPRAPDSTSSDAAPFLKEPKKIESAFAADHSWGIDPTSARLAYLDDTYPVLCRLSYAQPSQPQTFGLDQVPAWSLGLKRARGRPF